MKQYTENELKAIYREYSENVNWTAPGEVRNAYTELMEVLDEYIEAISEFSFKSGFKYAGILQQEISAGLIAE